MLFTAGAAPPHIRQVWPLAAINMVTVAMAGRVTPHPATTAAVQATGIASSALRASAPLPRGAIAQAALARRRRQVSLPSAELAAVKRR
jgi:hypothetical protein